MLGKSWRFHKELGLNCTITLYTRWKMRMTTLGLAMALIYLKKDAMEGLQIFIKQWELLDGDAQMKLVTLIYVKLVYNMPCMRKQDF